MRLKSIVVVLTSTIFAFQSHAQNLDQGVVRISSDSSMNMLETFWKIEANQINYFEGNHDHFYKAIYLTEENHNYSELLGESIHKLFIIKGQYGEFVDGELYFIGDFYNILELTVTSTSKRGSAKVGVLYGGIAEPNYRAFNLP